MNALIKAISNYKIIVIIVLMFALFAGFQSFFHTGKTVGLTGEKYTKYNNYVIFKQSFYHLVENKDLYQLYPKEHWDFYKYSPTFSVFFGVFAIFPDLIGLSLWNIFNALIFLLAVYYLPVLNKTQKGLVLAVCLIELMTSFQNGQSNALVAGLIILTFGLLEKRNYFIAALCIVFSIYIKLFGIVGLALFLFYPKKWKLALYTFGWALVLFVLPLIFVGFVQLKFLYSSWMNLLANDHSVSYGYSVMGWLHSWFGSEMDKIVILIAGVIAFLIPLLRFKEYKKFTFRFLTLTSILVWIVIFNHKAESPTFIIAMAGVSLWFITSNKSALNITLFVSAIVLTSLSPTDIFPVYLKEKFVIPYMLKVFPCILIWLKIIYDMMALKEERLFPVQ